MDNEEIIETIDFTKKTYKKVLEALVKLNSIGKIDYDLIRGELESIVGDYDTFILGYKAKNLKYLQSLRDSQYKVDTILVNFLEVKEQYENLLQKQNDQLKLEEATLNESLKEFKDSIDSQKSTIVFNSNDFETLIDTIVGKSKSLNEQIIKYSQNLSKEKLNIFVLEAGNKSAQNNQMKRQQQQKIDKINSGKKKKWLIGAVIVLLAPIIAYKTIKPLEIAFDNMVWSSAPKEIDLYGISNLMAETPIITNGKYVGPPVSEMTVVQKNIIFAVLKTGLTYSEVNKILAKCAIDNTDCANGTHFTLAANAAKRNGKLDELELLIDARVRRTNETFNISPHYKLMQKPNNGQYYLLKTN